MAIQWPSPDGSSFQMADCKHSGVKTNTGEGQRILGAPCLVELHVQCSLIFRDNINMPYVHRLLRLSFYVVITSSVFWFVFPALEMYKGQSVSHCDCHSVCQRHVYLLHSVICLYTSLHVFCYIHDVQDLVCLCIVSYMDECMLKWCISVSYAHTLRKTAVVSLLIALFTD